MTASEAAKEAVWLRKFLIHLEVVPDTAQPVILYCDNSRAVTNFKELRSHKCLKHIERRYHLIREIIVREDVEGKQISTHDNIVDPFTKILSIRVFENHLEGLGIKDYNSLL